MSGRVYIDFRNKTCEMDEDQTSILFCLLPIKCQQLTKNRSVEERPWELLPPRHSEMGNAYKCYLDLSDIIYNDEDIKILLKACGLLYDEISDWPELLSPNFLNALTGAPEYCLPFSTTRPKLTLLKGIKAFQGLIDSEYVSSEKVVSWYKMKVEGEE